jgi:hypothetical protein
MRPLCPLHGDVLSFPTTGILDDFTRADENPLSDSGNWTNPLLSGDGVLKLSSDTVIPADDTGDSSAYWATGFSVPVECYFTVASFPDGNSGNPALWACVSGEDTGSLSGYHFETNNANEVWVERWDSGTLAETFLDITGLSLGDGDGFGLSVGALGAIEIWHAPGGTGWVSLGTHTDATYTSGKLGLGYSSPDTGSAPFTSFGGGGGVVAPPSGKHGLYLTVTDLAGAPLSIAEGRPLPGRTTEQPQVTIPLGDSRTGQFSVSMYEEIARALVDSGTPTSAAHVVVKVLYINPKGDESLVLNGILINPDADFDAGTVTCQLHDHTIRLKNRYLGYDHASICLSWGVTVGGAGNAAYTDAVLEDVGLGEFFDINSVFGVPLDGYGLRLLLLDASHGANDWPGGETIGDVPTMGIRYSPGVDSVDNANPQPAFVVTDGNAVPPTGIGGLMLGGGTGHGFSAMATEGSAVLEAISFSGSTDKADNEGSWSDLYEYGALYGPGVPQFAVIDSFDEGAGTITMSLPATENTGATTTGMNAYYVEDAVYCQLTRGDCIYDDITDMVQAQGAFECDWVPVDKDHTGFSDAAWESGQFVELYTANNVGTDRSKGNGSVTPVQFVHGQGGFKLTWSPDSTQLVTYAVQCGTGGDVDPNDYLNKAIIIAVPSAENYGLWEQWAQATSAGDGDTLTSNTVLADRARAVLTAYQNPPQFITATVDTDVIGAYCYGTDYFLGDEVTIFGRKGYCTVGPLKVRITQVGITQVDASGNCQISLQMVPFLTAAPGVSPDEV